MSFLRSIFGLGPNRTPAVQRVVQRGLDTAKLRRQPAGPFRLSYRTKDGRADYRFSYERQSNGTWRAYIDSQPGYGGREDGAHPTHRLSDGSRKYVCWSAPIRSLDQAKQVSALWSDATQEYIRSGKRF